MKRRNFLLLSGTALLAGYITASNYLMSPWKPLLYSLKKRKNMKALILGASGMVGNELLRLCLDCNEISEITAIVRKNLNQQHSKLTQIVHNDFNNFTTLDLKKFDICFYCIGTYTGKVSEQEFSHIIVDISKNFATELKRQNPNIIYCHLGGAGADETEQSKTMFAREFGRAENYLKSLNFQRLHLFRPGYIYPVTPRKEPNFMYILMRIMYKPFLSHSSKMATNSKHLAEVMLDVALSDTNQLIYENIDIEKYGNTNHSI